MKSLLYAALGIAQRIFNISEPPISTSGPNFLELLKEYSTRSIIENSLTAATAAKHDFYYNNISLFFHSIKMSSCPIADIRVKHMDDLRFWLHKNLKTCTYTHASRHVNFCKAAVKYAVKQEYIQFSAIEPAEIKHDKAKQIICLDMEEFKRLIVYRFDNDIYSFVKDLYLFQCATGLSYIDLWQYEIEDDGEMEWITCANGRGKNGNEYAAEFNSLARTIHDKHEGKLPKIANQTYNRALKEMAHILNIKKKLSTTTGRKTFATFKSHEGYSDEAIAEMLGNTVEVARKHYIKKSRQKIKMERAKLQVA